MTNKIIVQAINANDWQDYKALRLQSLQDSPNAFGSTYAEEALRVDEEWEARLNNALTSQQARVFFALLDGNPSGLVWAKFLDRGEPMVALYQMWVVPQARRLGAASALLDAAITWAESKGAQRLLLEVTTTEIVAIRFYQGHGFAPTGETAPLREHSDLMMQTMLRQLLS